MAIIIDPAGLSAAIEQGWHLSSQNDMANALRNYMFARPKRSFVTVEAGKIYYYKSKYGSSTRIFKIDRLTEKRGKLAVTDISVPENSHSQDLFAGTWDGEFYELDDFLISMFGVTHRGVIEYALEEYSSRIIPPEIRRCYPELFISIPKEFANRKVYGDAEPAEIERVRDTLRSNRYGSTSHIGPREIELFIEQTHHEIRSLQATKAEVEVLGKIEMAEDYEKWILDKECDIAYYRWLIPMVDVGGIFYITGTENNQTIEDNALSFYASRRKALFAIAIGEDK